MRIFIDLDGVLADFDAAAAAIFGMPPREFEELHGARVFWKRLADAPAFYESLEWMPGGRELLEHAIALSVRPPMVLTGLPLGDWAEPQKRAWCARELGPTIPVICCRSIDKHRYAVAGDVLIDDRLQNGLDWTTAGGIFIHHIDAARSIEQLEEAIAAAEPAQEDPMDKREDAATEHRISGMDAELQGADLSKSGFVDVRELASIVFDADRRLRMAAGETRLTDWRDAPAEERDECEQRVAIFLNEGKTPAPEGALELARTQLLVGIVGALRDFTRR